MRNRKAEEVWKRCMAGGKPSISALNQFKHWENGYVHGLLKRGGHWA